MPRETVLQFIDAINRHDVIGILSLMSEDHVFIDACDGREDKKAMIQGWPGYFAWFPDYRIEVSSLMEDGNAVGIFGYASGTWQGKKLPDNKGHWRLPAAWRAEVADGKVKVWQVFCDTKIPYEAMD